MYIYLCQIHIYVCVYVYLKKYRVVIQHNCHAGPNSLQPHRIQVADAGNSSSAFGHSSSWRRPVFTGILVAKPGL